MGKEYIITPPYSTDIGLVYKSDASTNYQKSKIAKNILEAIDNFLKEQKVLFIDIIFPPHFTDGQPFNWSGYSLENKYTYILDLAQSPEELISQMSPERRKNIKDGYKNILIEKCDDQELIKSKIKLSLNENKAHYNNDIVDGIIKNMNSDKNHICLKSYLNGQLTSIHSIVKDENVAYYLFGWSDKSVSSYAGTIGLWSCIMESKNHGVKSFNFAGSSIPAVEKYFRGFGPTLIPMLNIKKQSTIGSIILKFKK